MPSVTYLRDTRDDPVNSTKGTYNTFDIGSCVGLLWVAGELWPGAGAERDLLQVSPELGVCALACASGWRHRTATLGFIPLPERYFVGGSNSHRGFAINQAGPRDPYSGAPLGGNAMFVNNLELRLPPAPLP